MYNNGENSENHKGIVICDFDDNIPENLLTCEAERNTVP